MKDSIKSSIEVVSGKASSKVLSNIAGAGISVLMSSVIDPFASIMIGGAVASGLDATFNDIMSRQLSEREKAKIETVVTLAAIKLKARLDAGGKLRDDGFFESKDGEESDASQFVEGVLLKTKNEHEKLKLPYLANLIASSATSNGTPNLLNGLLRTAENLTYRDLCLLSFFSAKNPYILRKKLIVWRNEVIPFDTIYICNHSFNLYSQGILFIEDRYKPDGILDTDSMPIINTKLSLIGGDIVALMGLLEIPQRDINEIYWYLKKTQFEEGALLPPESFLSLSREEIDGMDMRFPQGSNIVECRDPSMRSSSISRD